MGHAEDLSGAVEALANLDRELNRVQEALNAGKRDLQIESEIHIEVQEEYLRMHLVVRGGFLTVSTHRAGHSDRTLAGRLLEGLFLVPLNKNKIHTVR